MKKTKIVSTLGPASEDQEIFRELVKKGLNVARLNFSHGDHDSHGRIIKMIKKVRKELNEPVAILLDTKGPEIRTGEFGVSEVFLKEGDRYTLTSREVLGDEKICSVSYPNLARDIEVGNKILIDDGLVELKVEKISQGTDIECIVENPGIIKSNKGINVPGAKIKLPAITEKDIEDIKFGINMGIDFIAASFVRKAEDVLEVRKILEENKGQEIQIIGKIENQEGIDNLDEIIQVSDGIMVARGDLGVEVPTEEIPLIQKHMIEKCNKVGKPVITATQMLDSMMRNPRPTRAEVTDIANAILDGTDAIMLSGETAIGKYPIEAVNMMRIIAKRTEDSIDFKELLRSKVVEKNITITDAISNGTCLTAMDLQASAIITATSSGYTARMVSKFRPKAPIIATTTKESIRRRMSLVWGVTSIITEELETTDDIIEVSTETALREGLIERGELVVITAGVPVGVAGTTNLIKAHIVGDILLSGTGIGKNSATGRVVIIDDRKQNISRFKEGDILVCQSTDRDLVDIIEGAGAIVTEGGGITSHAAIVGLHYCKPTVVGAESACSKLKNGDIVTVDANTGLIYSGKTRIL